MASENIASFFESLLGFAAEGTNFVFGGMSEKGLAFIFLACCAPSSLSPRSSVFFSTGVFCRFSFRLIGTLLSKVNGMGKLESFNAVRSLILGQSENFIAYKGVLGDSLFTPPVHHVGHRDVDGFALHRRRFMSMLDAKYVVAALILNMFSTFIVLSIINPTRPSSEEEISLKNCMSRRVSLKCSVNIFWPVLKSR